MLSYAGDTYYIYLQIKPLPPIQTPENFVSSHEG